MSAKEISRELEAPAELLKLAREAASWWEEIGQLNLAGDKPDFVRAAEKILAKYEAKPLSS